MNQLNSIILEGNLVKDSVLLEPVSGFKVCKFVIGVNRFYKNKNDVGVEEVSYFDIETYGKAAEFCERKAKKGRGVRVVGRLKQDHWKDDQGKTQNKVYVVAEHIEYKPVFQKDDKEETKQEVTETSPAPETEAAGTGVF